MKRHNQNPQAYGIGPLESKKLEFMARVSWSHIVVPQNANQNAFFENLLLEK